MSSCPARLTQRLQAPVSLVKDEMQVRVEFTRFVRRTRARTASPAPEHSVEDQREFLDSVRKLHDGWVLTHPAPPQPPPPARAAPPGLLAADRSDPAGPRQPLAHISPYFREPVAHASVHARAAPHGQDARAAVAETHGASAANGHVAAVGQPDIDPAARPAVGGSAHVHAPARQGWNPARIEALTGNVATMPREQLLRSIAALRADLMPFHAPSALSSSFDTLPPPPTAAAPPLLTPRGPGLYVVCGKTGEHHPVNPKRPFVFGRGQDRFEGVVDVDLALLHPPQPAAAVHAQLIYNATAKHYELVNRTKGTVYVNWAACKSSDEHAAVVRPGATLIIAGLTFHVIGKVVSK